jgi:acyl-CoA synthetase (AMP-forming)/AMP-acid ligase II
MAGSTVPAGSARPVGATGTGGGLSAGEIAVLARERLSSFKVPTIWLLAADAEEVPMTPTGKVDKQGLQRLLAERGTGA